MFAIAIYRNKLRRFQHVRVVYLKLSPVHHTLRLHLLGDYAKFKVYAIASKRTPKISLIYF